MVPRREFLLGLLATGATGLAGCLDEDADSSENGTDDEPTTDGAPSEDVPSDLDVEATGVYRVDVDAISDGSPTLTERGRGLQFTDAVEVTWGFSPVVERLSGDGDEPLPSVSVEPTIDTTDDAEDLFLAPAYDADADRWTVHVYVDERYYEARANHYVSVGRFLGEMTDEREIEHHDVTFTEHHDGVYKTTVEYGSTPADHEDPRQVFVTNRHMGDIEEADAGLFVGAQTMPTVVGQSHPDYDTPDEDDPAPMVELGFEYDPGEKTVTITHESGDAFRGEHVQVGFEGGLTETQFEGEVTAGDRLTVSVPSADAGEYLAVTWRGPEKGYSLVLGRFQIPE